MFPVHSSEALKASYNHLEYLSASQCILVHWRSTQINLRPVLMIQRLREERMDGMHGWPSQVIGILKAPPVLKIACVFPHTKMSLYSLFSRTIFYVIFFVRGPQNDVCLMLSIISMYVGKKGCCLLLSFKMKSCAILKLKFSPFNSI